MIHLDIEFVKKGEKVTATRDTSPDFLPDNTKVTIAVLENGMTSGRPSVGICVFPPNGTPFVAQTSARLFCATAKAIMARYPNLFDGE